MTTAHADDAAAWYRAHAGIPTRCPVPALALASQAFQAWPQSLDIHWIRDENQGLFDGLAEIEDPEERRLVFHEYALSRFWLHEPRSSWPPERERLKRSHVGVIRGWGVDSNGPSGAVLKGWAEQRFGLRPVFHAARLDRGDAAARYESLRMRGHLGGIGVLLDLLFTFCQEELRRHHPVDATMTLYRGTHDPESYTVKEVDGRHELVEFNSVSSFTADGEVAWEFGSAVWRVAVPVAKVVFFSGLLPRGLLQGEEEYIVLGGDYLVERLLW